MIEMRIGQGFDVHRYDPDRPLMLCGEHLEGEIGLSGHSDADVLLHAIGDAILGALGLEDIGHHFPDDDPAYALSRYDWVELRGVRDRNAVAALQRRGLDLGEAEAITLAQEGAGC